MKTILVIIFGILCFTPKAQVFAQSENRLFYNEPANNWLEALPVGNGRLGAMIYGGVEQEQIQFNEETLWTGGPHDYSHKGAYKHLDKIRQLLDEGKQLEAQTLAQQEFMSQPLTQKAYQPFGDLIMNFPGHKQFSNYHRELDLENALNKLSYQVDGVTYTREVFVSFPDQVIAIKIKSDKPGSLNFDLGLDSHHFQKSVDTNKDTQVLDVRVLDGEMHGKAILKVITDGTVNPQYKNIAVKGATSATIYLTAYTNFINFQDVSGNPQRYVNSTFKTFALLDYDEVKARHIKDYQTLYNRFNISFGGKSKESVPTNERI